MKIKLFTNQNKEAFEQELNTFDNTEGINVKFTQYEPVSVGTYLIYTAMVFYEDLDV